MLRNYLTDGTLLGPRADSVDTIATAANNLLSTAGGWLIPAARYESYWNVIGLFGLLFFAGMLASAAHELAHLDTRLIPATFLILAHTSLMVYSQLTTLIDPLDIRLMSPTVVPAFLIGSWVIQRLFLGFGHPLLRAAAMTVAGLLIVAYAGLSLRWVGTPPWGFAAIALEAADSPPFCRRPGRRVFANHAHYARYSGVFERAESLPRRKTYRSNRGHEDWQAFVSAVKSADVCLVWINNVGEDAPTPEKILWGDTQGVSVVLLSRGDSASFYRATLTTRGTPP